MSNSSRPPGSRPGQPRLDAVRCPHCDETTMPNLLDDGSLTCSCAAERPLPLALLQDAPPEGDGGTMPCPADDQAAAADPARGTLPQDAGQFGRDIETEGYEALLKPPAG